MTEDLLSYTYRTKMGKGTNRKHMLYISWHLLPTTSSRINHIKKVTTTQQCATGTACTNSWVPNDSLYPQTSCRVKKTAVMEGIRGLLIAETVSSKQKQRVLLWHHSDNHILPMTGIGTVRPTCLGSLVRYSFVSECAKRQFGHQLWPSATSLVRNRMCCFVPKIETREFVHFLHLRRTGYQLSAKQIDSSSKACHSLAFPEESEHNNKSQTFLSHTVFQCQIVGRNSDLEFTYQPPLQHMQTYTYTFLFPRTKLHPQNQTDTCTHRNVCWRSTDKPKEHRAPNPPPPPARDIVGRHRAILASTGLQQLKQRMRE